MNLLVTYVVCLLIGQSITIAVGLSIDKMYSSAISLPVSIAMYFLMFWVTWKIAVRITEPRSAELPPSTPSPPRR
jgi:hypothetical protein